MALNLIYRTSGKAQPAKGTRVVGRGGRSRPGVVRLAGLEC